jgi:hypothetical protein
MTSTHPARSRCREHRTVLAGVKAKPQGWPAASLDTGYGGNNQHRSGAGRREDQQAKIRLTEVSAVSGDCQTGHSSDRVSRRASSGHLVHRPRYSSQGERGLGFDAG